MFISSFPSNVIGTAIKRKSAISISLIWFCCLAITCCGLAQGDIINWQTGETIPGTEGISPEPGVSLTNWRTEPRNLRFADFKGMNLESAAFSSSWLDDSRFTNADLTNAALRFSVLTNADLSGALVAGANFSGTTSLGFTKEHLYSTASYEERNLRGIGLGGNDLTAWDFSGQELTNASLSSATLTNTNLAGAVVAGASFSHSTSLGFTKEQLYSTASYGDKNLEGIVLASNDLTGWDFSGQDLKNASLWGSTLTNANLTTANLTNASLDGSTLTNANLAAANLTDAALRNSTLTNTNLMASDLTFASLAGSNLTNANLADAVVTGTDFQGTSSLGFAKEQLYSTASYADKNLQGIVLDGNNLSAWDFMNQDLRNASLKSATMTNADLAAANLTNAFLDDSTLTNANLAAANLTNASLWGSTLTNANFADAVVRGTDFGDTTLRGFTKEQFFSTVSYQSTNLQGVGLGSNDLTAWDFSGQDLTNASLRDSTLTNANLAEAKLTNASLRDSTLTNANLAEAKLTNASLRGSTLTNANLAGADLTNANLHSSTLTNTNLAEADLTNASLWGSTLTNANFADAVVRGTDFGDTTLRGFTKEQLYSTVSYQSKHLRGISLRSNDLTGWDFSGQDLTNAFLDSWFGPESSTLTNANLAEANLTNASLRGAKLTNANFADAVVRGTDFGDTTLRGFTKEQLFSTASYQSKNLQGVGLGRNDLTGWDFSGQDLTNVSLWGSTLTNANLTGTNLFGADLRDVRGFSPVESTVTRNAIWPDGHIRGIELRTGEYLPIVPLFRGGGSDGTLVEDAFTVADGATLEVRVGTDDEVFGTGSSHLVLTSGIPVELGGSLRVVWEPMIFMDLVRFPLRGSYDLFDWPGLLEPDNVFSSLELPPGAWDVSQLYTSGQITLMEEYRDDGDFDVDDQLNADDIDQLSAAVRAGRDLSFDVNGDGLLNQEDRRLWVNDLKNTFFGDANLDGMVDAADLNELALNWNGIAAGWEQGDFTGDAIVNAADLNQLALNWQAGVNPNATAHTIPEPTGMALAVVGLVVFSVLRRRR